MPNVRSLQFWLACYACTITVAFGTSLQLNRQAKRPPLAIDPFNPSGTPLEYTITGKLEKALKPLIVKDRLSLVHRSEGICVIIPSDELFTPGTSRLSAKAGSVLIPIVDILLEDPHDVWVQGHAETLPGSDKMRPWRLASNQAIAIVQYLSKKSSFRLDHFAVVSHGDSLNHWPSNSAINRANNRRIELIFKSRVPWEWAPDPWMPMTPPPAFFTF